jgi:hypothetical protein
MTITNLFSKRQKAARGEVPDVYRYDHFPTPFRVQVVHILNDALGNGEQYFDQYGTASVRQAYDYITNTLCREYGLFVLPPTSKRDANQLAELQRFILTEQDGERLLDAIELSFRVIDRATRKGDYLNKHFTCDQDATAAIDELNARFKQHGIGYQFDDGFIIRVDSQFVHAEAVKPALVLLHSKRFAGPEAEFLKAHEHYRHGRMKESLTECLKALESTMKTIASTQAWTVPDRATASSLISVMVDKGLIPVFWQTHFTGIRTMLEAGVPTVRNKLGGHGQGSEITDVPEHVVAFALHQTAAALVFLVESERALK